MQIETVKPTYLDEHLKPEFNNHRVDIKGQRWYVRIYPDDSLRIAPAWTTIKNKCAPMEPRLFVWKTKNEMEYTEFVSKNSANYGTFFHVLCGSYLMGNGIKLNNDVLNEIMRLFFEKEDYDYKSCVKWMKQEGRDLRKDLYGFSVFCKDWEVEPLAIEYPVMNKDGLYAATIDLVCRMTNPKTEEQFIAIIDLKSTTKGLDHEDYELQLLAQWLEWNLEWPEFAAQRIFNYGCHNYRLPLSNRVTPYKLKDQSFCPHKYKWPLWLQLFHANNDNRPALTKTEFKQDAEIRLNENMEVFETYDILDRVKNFDKELF